VPTDLTVKLSFGMGTRRRQTKKVTQGQITGQKGENLIERIVLDMEFIWRSTGGTFDTGIDGRIELRNARTGEPLHREVRVQSKGYAAYTRETETSFEFLCNAADIDYWMRSAEPVILVCSHPNDPQVHQVWFRCVTDWFADKERRAARKVIFDKEADRFDASCGALLLNLANSHEPAAPYLPPPPPEHVLSNLFPITEYPRTLWSVETDATKRAHVASTYVDAQIPDPDWDFVLHDRRVYTLRDPRTTSVRRFADTSTVEAHPSSDWSHSDDSDRRALWVQLLRRSLEHQLRPMLRWHEGDRLFYFPGPKPLKNLEVDGPSGPRLVVKVQPNRPRPGERHAEGIWYVRPPSLPADLRVHRRHVVPCRRAAVPLHLRRRAPQLPRR